jgi:hypothetical protein
MWAFCSVPEKVNQATVGSANKDVYRNSEAGYGSG